MSSLSAVRSGRFLHGEYELAYEVYGESGVPALLVHGLLLDSLLNRDLAQRFAGQGYQVILLDLLGHGQSDKPTDPRAHRIEFYGEQMIGVLDHLGIERALVGGISLGAIAALQMATQAPQRCLGLFLEMPVMENSSTFAAMLLTPLLMAVDFGKPAFRVFAHALRKLPRPPQAWIASGLNAMSAEPEVITAVLHGLMVGPIVPPQTARQKLDMPALVIGHGLDRLHELADAEGLVRDLPNARLLKARSMIELRLNPARLWPQIAEFLREVRDSAALPAPQDAADARLKARFEELAAQVRNAPKDGPLKPGNDQKLRLYALYRQASAGDAVGKRPSVMDPVARFKHDAWAALAGMSSAEAMRRYVDEVEGLLRDAGSARREA